MKFPLLSFALALSILAPSAALAAKTWDYKSVSLDPDTPESRFTLRNDIIETRVGEAIEWIKETCDYSPNCSGTNSDGSPYCVTHTYDCSHYGHRETRVKTGEIRVEGRVILRDIPAGLKLKKKMWVYLENGVFREGSYSPGVSDALIKVEKTESRRTEGTDQVIDMTYVFTAEPVAPLFAPLKGVKVLDVKDGIATISVNKITMGEHSIRVSLGKSSRILGTQGFNLNGSRSEETADGRSLYRVDIRDVYADWDRLPAGDSFYLVVVSDVGFDFEPYWNDDDFYDLLSKRYVAKKAFRK